MWVPDFTTQPGATIFAAVAVFLPVLGPTMLGYHRDGALKSLYNAMLLSTTSGREKRLRHEKSSASLQVRPSQKHSRAHVFQDEPHQSTQEL
jgi:hypothetical protein